MSGNARQRRAVRRRIERQRRADVENTLLAHEAIVNDFAASNPPGSVLRINSESYGASYHRRKGEIVGYEGGKALVKVNNRKTPLAVEIEHLAPAA